MKKTISLSILACVLLFVCSCGGNGSNSLTRGNDAAEAFNNGKLKVGSTYDEVVELIGEPDFVSPTDDGMAKFMFYLNKEVNTNEQKQFTVLVEKDDQGVFKVTKYSFDPKQAAYEQKINDTQFIANNNIFEDIKEIEIDTTSSEYKFYSQKVLKSEQKKHPGFDKYFTEVVEAEAAFWGDDGYLYQPDDESENKKVLVTFGRFNDRMNQAVCRDFGKEKCQKVAKAKGWVWDALDDGSFATVFYEKDGWPVKWYELYDELVKR